MPEDNSKPAREFSLALGLFLISAAILALEVLHVRILSVQMWYHHAYMVITMAFLGFAIAGTVTTVFPWFTAGNVSSKLACLSTLFAVFVVVGHLLVSQVADEVSSVTSQGSKWMLVATYTLLLLPYFFGGMVVTVALSSAKRVHELYFVNLVGSALGAWVFLVAITPLGAERLLAVLATIGALAGLSSAWHARSRTTTVFCLLFVLLGGVLIVKAPQVLKVEIGADKKRFSPGEIVKTYWTPLSRLDLLAQADRDKRLMIVQDGGAGTYMWAKDKAEPRPLWDAHSVPYVPFLHKMRAGGEAPDVLIIGVGGGSDLREAVFHGAKSVLGLEINPVMVQITGKDYAEFNGKLFELPGVEVQVGEGRSTLRRLERKFDIILIAGADTYTAGASGSFVLSESYLYTEEALVDFFDHLKPGGVLSILRFYDKPPRETLRIFGMAMLALRDRGIAKPSANVAVIRRGWFGGTVFSLAPLHPEVVKFFGSADEIAGDEYEALYVPGIEKHKKNPFTELAVAIDGGKEDEYFAAYAVDIRPVTDDSPFFFNFHHFWDSAEVEDSAFARETGTYFPVAPSILRTLLLQTSILVLLLVLLPLFFLRREKKAGQGSLRTFGFFLGLGAGFMLLEISSVQRLVLFLGHPTYALSVVLSSFLFFGGLGSLWAGKRVRDKQRGMRIALSLICAGILLLTFGLTPLLMLLLHLPLPARIAVALVILAPLNFLMGIPFPTGLAKLKALQPKLVPWVIGANGGASVIASILATVIAMEVGFALVSLVAFAAYMLALFCVLPNSGRGTQKVEE